MRPDASVERVERLLTAEIARVRNEPVSEEELSKAKRQLEVSLLNGLATNHALGRRIASDIVTLGRIRPLEERLEAIQRVTAADLERVARTYLTDDRRSVVRVVAPPESSGEAS